MRTLQTQTLEVQSECRSVKDDIKKVVTDIQNAQRRLEALESVSNQRLNNLKGFQKDTYQAVLWLRENKKRFKAEVYEPIVLLVNVTDQRYSKEVESSIPFQHLFVSFVYFFYFPLPCLFPLSLSLILLLLFSFSSSDFCVRGSR